VTATTATVARTDRDPFEVLDWVLLASLALIWGTSFMLIAIGLESLHPGVITWVRVGSGAVALQAVRRDRVAMPPATRRAVLRLSILWVVIPFTLFPIAEQHVNSAIAGILNGAVPVWAALFASIWFGRPTRGLQRIGIAVGFVGMVVVSLASGASGGQTAWLGIALVLVATVLYGWSINLLVPLQQEYGSIAVTRPLLAYAALATTPFGLWGLRWSTFEVVPVAAVLVLGIVGTGLAFLLMARLAGRVGGPRASMVTYLIPVVAVAAGVVVLDDRVTPAALVGVALVIGGAVAASRRER
jgi:drug/metabolite transporter (DMT)-like permease